MVVLFELIDFKNKTQRKLFSKICKKFQKKLVKFFNILLIDISIDIKK